MSRPVLRNPSTGGWIVQKFGGTSVGKFPEKIAEDIVRAFQLQLQLQQKLAPAKAGISNKPLLPSLFKANSSPPLPSRQYVSSNNRVVIVCSARSPGKKVSGTTSRLLEVYRRLQQLAAATAVSDERAQTELVESAQQIIQEICSEHLEAADAAIHDATLRAALRGEIEAECGELAEYVAATKRFHLEVNARSKDRLASLGEKLSCRFMTYVLRDHQVAAEYVDLADVLHKGGSSSSSSSVNLNGIGGGGSGSSGGSGGSSSSNTGNRLDAAFYHDAAAVFSRKIAACEDRVPVVTGFFGNVPGSLMDGDVGRGYTDLCAALVAVGLHAKELQVWKEVDGIFTADPSKVPTARLIPSITPSEAAELTFYGSEVIHHLTMDQVIKATPPIPVRIKNVKNPRGDGTIVLPDPVRAPGQQLQKTTAARKVAARKVAPATSVAAVATGPQRPTAVTIKDRISVLNIHSNKRSLAHGFVARVFSVLDQHQISVDLIATSEVHVSMAIHAPDAANSGDAGAGGAGGAGGAAAEDSHLERARRELGVLGDVSLLHGMAILSLVGADMKNMIGVAGKMFSTLGEHDINIEMISQGASEINISCVIDAQEATRAMNVLHTNLFTFLE